MARSRTKTVRISRGEIADQTVAPSRFGLNGRAQGYVGEIYAKGGILEGQTPPAARGPFEIPGPGAEINFEGEEQEDTVFGVDWRSNVPGPLSWSVSGRAFMRGRAGYFADISYFEPGFKDIPSEAAVQATPEYHWGPKDGTYLVFAQVGTGTGITVPHLNEEKAQTRIYRLVTPTTTATGSKFHLGYRDSTNPLILNDRHTWVSADGVHAAAVPATAATAFPSSSPTNIDVDEIVSYDPLRCQIEYTASPNPKFIYIRNIQVQDVVKKFGRPSSMTISLTSDMIDTTSINDLGAEAEGATEAKNVFRYMINGLKTASIEMTGIYQDASTAAVGSPGDLQLNLKARDLGVWMIIRPVGLDHGDTVAAMSVFPISRSQRGDVGALEEESFSGSLKVASSAATPVLFKALYGDGANALDLLWESFDQNCDVFVEYAPEGVEAGKRVFAGRAVVIDMSFTTSLDQVGEFSINLDGSGPVERTLYHTVNPKGAPGEIMTDGEVNPLNKL